MKKKKAVKMSALKIIPGRVSGERSPGIPY